MRAPDLEAMIAEGEQEALLDFGYEYVVLLVETFLAGNYSIDSNDLHREAGRLLACGEINPDDATKLYDAIWSVKRLLQDKHGPNKAVFTAEQWEGAARELSSRLDTPTR